MKVRLCKTRNGNGYKVLVTLDTGQETWLYTKKEYVELVFSDGQDSCVFREILEDQQTKPNTDTSQVYVKQATIGNA